MAIYSHSRLSTYEDCPLKYRLTYLDGIKRKRDSVEAFVGTIVHEALKKCYDDAKLTKLETKDELLAHYDAVWQRSRHDDIVITKKGLTHEHYRDLGKRMLETYYKRFAPFDTDTTIGTEMHVIFPLDDNDGHKIQGYIDRLSLACDDVYQIHDYRTSAYLPTQKEADSDRQLALYQIGIRNRWPDVGKIRLVWHYLAHGRELVSCRTDEDVSRLAIDTIHLIDQIESATQFLPKESGLCEWCEYPDLCPKRKHLFTLEALPADDYRQEPGLVLVNKYVDLRDQAVAIQEEMDRIKGAIIRYAEKENVELVNGSTHRVRVKVEEKLKFPGKADAERQELESKIKAADKWAEVSQLDTSALARALENRIWGRNLIKELRKHARLEETSSIYVSKLKEGEE